MPNNEGSSMLDLGREKTTADKGCMLHQTVGRKILADISNLPHNRRPLIQENKSQNVETATKEYIDQIQNEKMALLQMLAQRNTILERSGAQLAMLKVNMLKLQEQNKQLAVSNSQLVAELNSSKEREKVLQHELGCKNVLLKARKLEPEETAKARSTENDNAEEEGELSREGIDDKKGCKNKERLQSNSLDTSEQVVANEKTESKRPLTRRRSSRLKAAELKPDGGSSESEDSNATADFQLEKGSTCENITKKNAFDNDSSGQCARPGINRPSRQAARKVQSYKEVPVNIKMRRPE